MIDFSHEFIIYYSFQMIRKYVRFAVDWNRSSSKTLPHHCQYSSYLAQDLNDQTSLYLSVLGGHVDVVEYLLSFRVHALTSQEVEQFKRRSTHNYSNSDSN